MPVSGTSMKAPPVRPRTFRPSTWADRSPVSASSNAGMEAKDSPPFTPARARSDRDANLRAGRPGVKSSWRRARGQRWADLRRRTFGFDLLACPRGGGRLRLIALHGRGEEARTGEGTEASP